MVEVQATRFCLPEDEHDNYFINSSGFQIVAAMWKQALPNTLELLKIILYQLKKKSTPMTFSLINNIIPNTQVIEQVPLESCSYNVEFLLVLGLLQI